MSADLLPLSGSAKGLSAVHRRAQVRIPPGEPIRLSESSPAQLLDRMLEPQPCKRWALRRAPSPVSIVARLAWPIMRSSTPADGPFEGSVRAISRTWRQPRAIGA